MVTVALVWTWRTFSATPSFMASAYATYFPSSEIAAATTSPDSVTCSRVSGPRLGLRPAAPEQIAEHRSHDDRGGRGNEGQRGRAGARPPERRAVCPQQSLQIGAQIGRALVTQALVLLERAQQYLFERG